MSETFLEGTLRSRCEGIVNKYQEEAVRTAFSTILVLLKNIVNSPTDDQKRFFKKTNNTIKSKILIIKETVDLLKEIGYTDMDSEFMIYADPDLSNLNVAIKVLDSYVQTIDKKFAELQAAEEVKRQDDIKRRNEEISKKFRDEKLKQLEIQRRIDDDKREKAQKEKPTDSVGRKVDFGAKVCKFEPSNSGGG